MHWGSCHGKIVSRIDGIYVMVMQVKHAPTYSQICMIYMLKTCPKISSLFATHYVKWIWT